MSMDAGHPQEAARTQEAARRQEAERTSDVLQLEALLVARAYLYTLFGKLFGGTPDAELLEALLGGAAADCVEEFAAHSVELSALGGLLDALRGSDREALLGDARDEYTRVFIGPANLPASPYESPYTGAHDMGLFQENTVAVRREYHAAGLRVRREQAVPDDHVALLCAFMAQLGGRSLADLHEGRPAQLAEGLRAQLSFAERHLAHWLDTYAAAVRNSKAGARAVLYPQMIEALAAFVRADCAFLAESAFWAEGQVQPDAAWGAAPELDSARKALGHLEALHPFGIQDNELVPA